MLLVDSHVHVHPGVAAASLLDAAAAHFAAAADGADWTGALLLTESAGCNVFAAWRQAGDLGGGWRASGLEEETALALRGPGGARLIVGAGRQIRCREGLEVLALGTLEAPPDGEPLAQAVDRARRTAAAAVLPWGVGKWWGPRGRLVARLVAEAEPGSLLLGDNAARPWCWPRPPLFARAAQRGVYTAAGTDPLPFAGEERTAGRYGNRLEDEPDPTRPVQALLRRLAAAPAPVYGSRESLWRFFRNQAAMQVRGRKGSRT